MLSLLLFFTIIEISSLIFVIYNGSSFSYFSDLFKNQTITYLKMQPLHDYFLKPSDQIGLAEVLFPSTMLTSVWTFLLFVSCVVVQLLVPIDYLRRFTTFWFKDVEHKPLTAIAKVAATLIVVGAFAIKGVRWISGSA